MKWGAEQRRPSTESFSDYEATSLPGCPFFLHCFSVVLLCYEDGDTGQPLPPRSSPGPHSLRSGQVAFRFDVSLRGSGLAGGFQRAKKLVFVVPSAVYLAFVPHGTCLVVQSGYASSGSTCSWPSWWTSAGVEGLQTHRVQYEDAVPSCTCTRRQGGRSLLPRGPVSMSFSFMPWVVLSVWLWGPFPGFPGFRQVQHAGECGSVERLRIAWCE